MGPLRLAILLLPNVLLLTCILYLTIFSRPAEFFDPQPATEFHSHSRRFLNFRGPSAFFSPSATISLTDDNSTFFAASPAAFGPALSRNGLSGELWVGSGFGADNLQRQGIAADVEGELGCADVPGWREGRWTSSVDVQADHSTSDDSLGNAHENFRHGSSKASKIFLGGASDQGVEAAEEASHALLKDDGTDDRLHYPLHSTNVYKHDEHEASQKDWSSVEHADIQSMQESAEIAGRVVLLSRGGCGFSEKVKWAQRRGASAVIVGDSIRGGPLVTMYARGDATNITIPSIFTSHTTAHLLSSLIPPDGVRRSSQHSTSRWSSRTGESSRGKSTKPSGMHKALGGESRMATCSKSDVTPTMGEHAVKDVNGITKPNVYRGWLHFRTGLLNLKHHEQEAYDDRGSSNSHFRNTLVRILHSTKSEVDKGSLSASKAVGTTGMESVDKDFIIGINDWRDPVVAVRTNLPSTTLSSSPVRPQSTSTNANLKGGSITPGSGVYESTTHSKELKYAAGRSAQVRHVKNMHLDENIKRSKGWLSRFSWSTDVEATAVSSTLEFPSNGDGQTKRFEDAGYHTGLWVTLTPANMTTNPFFSTLFVLVVSPLVTLSIVYGMLLLRSRIRRRRWRAPKSLVERLPVRIYRAFSPRSSGAGLDEQPRQQVCTATTPLLAGSQPTNVPLPIRSRAVACDTSDSVASSSFQYGSLESRSVEQEKTASALAAWRRRNVGKQVECVVCLEEYVDGVSRVMSLPCGHEFHVDCITPWLTTRRRTCPICKGDVVRSMGRVQDVSAPPEAGGLGVAEGDMDRQAPDTTDADGPTATVPTPRDEDDLYADVQSGRNSPPLSLEESRPASPIARNAQRNRESLGQQPIVGRVPADGHR